MPPEQLLRALLLQVLYTVRSERMLIEQLEYNLLFRWFVGLAMDDELWVPTTFTKNRGAAARGRHRAALLRCRPRAGASGGLLSDEHFTVDGTLLEAWASHKSFDAQGDEPPTPSDDRRNPT